MKVVKDWRKGWKWSSVHFSALSVGLNVYGAIVIKGAAAATSLVGLLPMRYALIVGAAVSLGALVGRFVYQGPKRGK